MNALVLIVEDEPEIAEILVGYLEREGFRTVAARDGLTAVDLHLALRPDIVLLDVGLPKLDGWEVLARLRRRGATPVIMLTALDQDLDKLQALRIGADDYVVKPFNPLEVAARAKAVLRRTVGRDAAAVARAGPLDVDPVNHTATVNAPDGPKRLALTLTEFRLLLHMAQAPMRLYTRAELLDACLSGGDALERTVDGRLAEVTTRAMPRGRATIQALFFILCTSCKRAETRVAQNGASPPVQIIAPSAELVPEPMAARLCTLCERRPYGCGSRFP